MGLHWEICLLLRLCICWNAANTRFVLSFKAEAPLPSNVPAIHRLSAENAASIGLYARFGPSLFVYYRGFFPLHLYLRLNLFVSLFLSRHCGDFRFYPPCRERTTRPLAHNL